MTGVTAVEDSNSYWSVRGTSDAACHRGAPVLCGQNIRLTHVNTGRNLHSHYFTSPLSSNQVLIFFNTHCNVKVPYVQFDVTIGSSSLPINSSHLGGQCLWWERRGWPSGRVDRSVLRLSVAAGRVRSLSSHGHRGSAVCDGRAVRQTHPRPERSARHDDQQLAQLLENDGGRLHETQWDWIQGFQQSITHWVLEKPDELFIL